MFSDFINELKTQLNQPLPGVDVQFEMAHIDRSKIDFNTLSTDYYKKSAVMISIFEKNNRLFIPIIERITYDGPHSGQLALPGGKHEQEDITLEQTAKREFIEEIGVTNTEITIIGELSPIYIPVSQFVVYPYVAFLKDTPQYIIDKREVNALIELDLMTLIDDSIVKTTTLQINDKLKIKTPYFDIRGKVLWGATAMMLNELKFLLKRNRSFISF